MDEHQKDWLRTWAAEVGTRADRTRETALRVTALLAEAEERLARSPAQISARLWASAQK
jgi:hypothetical protein